MTERLDFHFSLSCIGEGNGNPLQCSCLENPRDRGAWWAAVCGVAQSRTRLKWLSSSSSSKRLAQSCLTVWSSHEVSARHLGSVERCREASFSELTSQIRVFLVFSACGRAWGLLERPYLVLSLLKTSFLVSPWLINFKAGSDHIKSNMV